LIGIQYCTLHNDFELRTHVLDIFSAWLSVLSLPRSNVFNISAKWRTAMRRFAEISIFKCVFELVYGVRQEKTEAENLLAFCVQNRRRYNVLQVTQPTTVLKII